ncbi:small ribosomal subunit protein bS16m-like [Sycon ciliatum]|uniref:small ribosomal subunit protein bS16m-like n=1 Tax=Sycon ciliatum TaxID=27933 RepID=UPI0020AE8E19|eukprot:scpid94637/ scgid32421/ 28S ribosomal protein S16, mitochondrial
MPHQHSMRISLQLFGCTNRPFFIIAASRIHSKRKAKFVEQLGSYDPLINVHGEKLVSLKFSRVKYWLSEGARATPAIHDILAFAGLEPPRQHMAVVAPYMKEAQEHMKTQEKQELDTWRESILDKGLDPDELLILASIPKADTPAALHKRDVIAKLKDAGFEESELSPPPKEYWDGSEPAFRQRIHPRMLSVMKDGRRLGKYVTPSW